jgi:colicin import membrane protein
LHEATAADADALWWQQLDARTRSIICDVWEHQHSREVAEAMGRYAAQAQRENDLLRRSLAVAEREIEQLRDQIGLRTAADEVAEAVKAAREQMPTLEAELRRDLARARRDAEATRAMVDDGKRDAEMKALERKILRLRVKTSMLEHAIGSHVNAEQAAQRREQREAEAELARAEREQQEAAARAREPGTIWQIDDSAAHLFMPPPASEESAS